MVDHRMALETLERAYAELRDYLALPVNTRRDKAGIIQAFEFTFELFWKLFQKLAPDEGLEAATPRQALQAARKMKYIGLDEEDHWSQMLRDRNLTSHTYRHELADEVYQRIRDSYSLCFSQTIERIRQAL